MLKCGYCGYENEGDPKFCGKCGKPVAEAAPAPSTAPAPAPTSAPVPASVPKPKPQSEFVNKLKSAFSNKPNLSGGALKIIRVAVPAVIAVLLIAIIAVFAGGGSDYGKKGDMLVFGGDDVVYVFTPNGSVKMIEGKYSSSQISLDRNEAAILADYDAVGGGTLYYVSGNKNPAKIAESVYRFVLSDAGEGIAYYSEYDSTDSVADISLYDGKTGKSFKIDPNAYLDWFAGEVAAISPDGKTVMYMRYDSGDGVYMTYISVNGKKAEKLGDDVFPVGVADDAKYIYYRDKSSVLFVKKGIKAERARLGEYNGSVFFNNDYSQVVYNSGNYNNTTGYISVKGGDKTKISGGVSFFLTPDGDVFSGGRHAYDFKSFKGKAFFSGYSDVYILDGKFEKSSVCKGASTGYIMTEDGKWLYYTDSNRILKRASLKNPNADKVTVTKDYGGGFAVNGDKVYYVNRDGELYYKKATAEGDGKKVDDEVSPDQLKMFKSGKLYYLKDYSSRDGGTLCRANGSKKKRIKDEIAMLQVGASNVYCFIKTDDYHYDVYGSGGGSFKKKAADVEVRFG